MNPDFRRLSGTAIFLSLAASLWVCGPAAQAEPPNPPASPPASRPAELAQPASQPTTAPIQFDQPASQPAHLRQPHGRAGHDHKAIRPDQFASDLEWLQDSQKVVGNWHAHGDYQIGDALHVGLNADGNLDIQDVGFASLQGIQRIQVRGADPAMAKATWIVNILGGPEDLVSLHLERYDFDQTAAGQMWHMAVTLSSEWTQIEGWGIGFSHAITNLA